MYACEYDRRIPPLGTKGRGKRTNGFELRDAGQATVFLKIEFYIFTLLRTSLMSSFQMPKLIDSR